jgi:gamma-glutamyl-gamma-aminobutyrate hydrolase PuuD
VNSYHHQAVSDAGALTVTGWADDDVIEAVEDPARRFVFGVQWHPEAPPTCDRSPRWSRPPAEPTFAILDACYRPGR